MKKTRILKRSFALLFGAIGLTSLFSSCHKERTCDCTQSYTYSYIGGASYTNSIDITKKTEEKCWELNETTEYSYGNATYSQSIACDN
ncbi:MAG: hypothetical protein KC454_08245 [Flavobacteriales bacterium]|nr:hypothetical protein [Flavobacteriales bacterium]